MKNPVKIAVPLLAAALSAAPVSASGTTIKQLWMGSMSCGAWPKYTPHGQSEKSIPLNWVLGYLSRSAIANETNIIGAVDHASIAAWIDNYCQSHPLDDIPTATRVLEAELLSRSRPAR